MQIPVECVERRETRFGWFVTFQPQSWAVGIEKEDAEGDNDRFNFMDAVFGQEDAVPIDAGAIFTIEFDGYEGGDFEVGKHYCFDVRGPWRDPADDDA